MGDRRGAYKVMVGKPEGSDPLGRHRRRWEAIKMDLSTNRMEDVVGLRGSG
jgi:hypothetical protein